MSKRNEAIRCSCVTCGTGYIVYPPDSNHRVLHLDPEGLKDYIPMTIKCENPKCEKPEIKLYWESPEITFRLV